MSPNLYGDGLARVEHFDTVTEQARPFRVQYPSSNGVGVATTVLELQKFIKGTDTLYALGKDASSTTYPAIYKWDTNQFDWRSKMTFGLGRDASPILLYYLGNIYGLHSSGDKIWKMTTAGVYTDAFQDLAHTVATTDPIVHSKDGLAYFFTDNNITKFDGTTATLVLTFPTNFLITSACEYGDYIQVVGYDSELNKSTAYLWDRDSSLSTLSEKYDIGVENVYHNAVLGGITFMISARLDVNNSNFSEKPVLVIKHLQGSVIYTLMELEFESLSMSQYGKHVTKDRLYFSALVKMKGDSTAKNVIFCLDSEGRLTIAQNLGVDTGTAIIKGIYRDGDAFWVAGGTDGAWNTSTTYTTTASIETTKIRSDDFKMSVDFVGAVATFEPLPTAGQVVLSTRADAETSWTTLATWTTDSSVVGVVTKQGCATQPSFARERQFRLESTGGAVITGLQIDLAEVANQSYE